MGQFTIDRMTINWQGEAELSVASQLRQKAGARGINRLVKQIIKDWLETKRINSQANNQEATP